MKPLFKGIVAACASIMLCGLLCCTASAYTGDDLKAKHDDINSNNNAYGADITYSILSEDKKEVKATITQCYEDEPIDIPETVTLTDSATGDSETFKAEFHADCSVKPSHDPREPL